MPRVLCVAVLVIAARAQSLDEKIHSAISAFPAKVSIYAKNLDTGATYTLHGEEPVRTASTIKLAILAATFAAVDEGKIKWTDPITLRDSDKVSGSGILTEFSDGVRIPLSDLAHLMIVLSDNTATNLILDRVSSDYVNAQMDKLGLKHIRSMRKIRGDGAVLKDASGFSQAGKLPENGKFGIGSATPHEMVTLLEKVERGEVVSREASNEMLKILKRQQDHNGIARRMGETVVANKAGALDHLRSDVGIVYSKGGRIAIAITCDDIPQVDWSSDNPGLLMIARLSELLVTNLAK